MVILVGAQRARAAKGLVPLLLAGVLGAGCEYTPAGRERAAAVETLRAIPGVAQVSVGCEGGLLASNGLCADVEMKEGQKLRFEQVGHRSFGANAGTVVVASAGGLVPRIASCTGVGFPNFHRSGPLGHHFEPTLIDVKDAVTRAREVLEEVQFWPQCPQSWEVQDRRGENFRYCARRREASEEPPAPSGCKGK